MFSTQNTRGKYFKCQFQPLHSQPRGTCPDPPGCAPQVSRRGLRPLPRGDCLGRWRPRHPSSPGARPQRLPEGATRGRPFPWRPGSADAAGDDAGGSESAGRWGRWERLAGWARTGLARPRDPPAAPPPPSHRLPAPVPRATASPGRGGWRRGLQLLHSLASSLGGPRGSATPGVGLGTRGVPNPSGRFRRPLQAGWWWPPRMSRVAPPESWCVSEAAWGRGCRSTPKWSTVKVGRLLTALGTVGRRRPATSALQITLTIMMMMNSEK